MSVCTTGHLWWCLGCIYALTNQRITSWTVLLIVRVVCAWRAHLFLFAGKEATIAALVVSSSSRQLPRSLSRVGPHVGSAAAAVAAALAAAVAAATLYGSGREGRGGSGGDGGGGGGGQCHAP